MDTPSSSQLESKIYFFYIILEDYAETIHQMIIHLSIISKVEFHTKNRFLILSE